MEAERLEEKILNILSRELQLDMPRPVSAKRKVVNEIIALIESQPKPAVEQGGSAEEMSLRDYVLWLNSMTLTELIQSIPNTFHILSSTDSPS
jgi:acyl carrier protein